MKRNILRELTFAFFVLCHVSCGKEFFLSKVNVNDNQKIHGNFKYIKYGLQWGNVLIDYKK